MADIIPKGQIEWIVDRFHAGTDDATIRADIERRMPLATASLRRRSADYAVRHHHDNRALYARVTGSM